MRSSTTPSTTPEPVSPRVDCRFLVLTASSRRRTSPQDSRVAERQRRHFVDPARRVRRHSRRAHPSDGDFQRAQSSVRRVGLPSKTSGPGDVQQKIRQLLEVRPRSVLRMGQGFQRVQAILSRVGIPILAISSQSRGFRLLQDVSNSTVDVCDSSVVKKKMVVTWGQSLHLGCFLKMPAVLASQTITWYHYSKEKGRYKIQYR